MVYKVLIKIMYLFYFFIFFNCGFGSHLLNYPVLREVRTPLLHGVRLILLRDNTFCQLF